MKNCKFCNSQNIKKDGIENNKQRWRCKDCKRVGVKGDKRQKYSSRFQKLALILYENGNGFRRIAEILSKIFNKKIYYQTIVKWIKNLHLNMKQTQTKESREYCDIVELDELFTYLKKSQERTKKQENMTNLTPEYGLLLIGTKIICVHIGLEKELS